METDCPVIEHEDETYQGLMPVPVSSSVQSQSAAAVIIQMNENDNSAVDVNNSTLQAMHLQERDLLGIENLGRLTHLQTEDAIKFIASHIGHFHELVNQKSIKDRQLNVLIQVIGKMSSPSCSLDVQTHLIRIVTNQHYLENILSYMRDSIAPRVDPVKYEARRDVFYSIKEPYCTDSFALTYLQTYFTFVEENLKELGTTNEPFTKGFSFLKELVGSYDQIEENQSNSSISEDDDLARCSSRRISTSSLCKTINKDVDPMSVESFRNLMSIPHPEAIKFIDSHFSQFEELLNQNKISNPTLIALITFIGAKLCPRKCSVPDLQKKLFLVITNYNFVRNIWNYINRKLITRIESGIKLKSLSGPKANSKSVWAPKIVLKNLLKFFKFVENNLKESAPTNFTECFNILTQLERSYEDGKRELQASRATISVVQQFKSELAINDPSYTNLTENLLGIEVLSTLLTKDSDEVMSIFHAQLRQLSKLIDKSISASHLNVLLQVLVSKICTYVTMFRDQNVEQLQFQKEILSILIGSKFLKKLQNHLNKIAKSFLKRRKSQRLATNETNLTPEMPLSYTPVEVFGNVCQYYYFLLMPKIRNEILLKFDYIDLLGRNINSAREFLQQIAAQGKVSQFSNQNPQAFKALQLSWKNLNTCSNQCTSKKNNAKTIKKTKAVSSEVKVRPGSSTFLAGNYFTSELVSDLIPTQIISQEQNATTKPEQHRRDTRTTTTTTTKNQPVISTAALFTVDHLIEMKKMPADQVFNLICIERKHFKQFITQNEISGLHLNLLISIIGSKLCSRTVFVHFQKYLFLMLLEKSFLKKIYNFTREFLRHINEQPPPPPYCSNTEIFESLYKFYNLLLIYCEDPPAQLKRNIRSGYGLLLNVIYNKNELSVTTVTELQRIAQLFKTLVAITAERTEMMELEATHNIKKESNVNHSDVDKDVDAEPTPPLSALLELESVTLMEPTVQNPMPIPRPEPEPSKFHPKSDLTIFLVTPSEPISDISTVMDDVDSVNTEMEMQELEITNYLGVPGFVRSVFFINRDECCVNDESKIVPADESSQNEFRADFLVALCRHVILQNYKASEVKVLANGMDQALLFKNKFETLENPFCSVDVGPLSSYDGNESDVMILSLQGPNANDVDRQFFNAFYKARHGCYILGNRNHLVKSNRKMWTQFFENLDDHESSGDKLELRCQIHKTDFFVTTSADFCTKAPEGGCCRPCDMPLEDCEHRCQKYCHVVDRNHEEYKCQILIDVKLNCGHIGSVECWRVKMDSLLINSSGACDSVCGAELDCGHVCVEKCHMFPSPGQETAGGEHPLCPEIVEAKLPCNHVVGKVPCFQVINREIKPSFQNDPNSKCTVLIKVKLPSGCEYLENCDVLRSANYINRTCESLCTRPCIQGHPCGRVHKCCVDCDPCAECVSHVLACGPTVSDLHCPMDIAQVE